MHVFHVPITTILIILLITILWKLIFSKTKHSSKLPPGPPPLPIIGNFHLLGRNPHRSLAQLAQKYGPIMSLRLGQIQTFVVSSPTYAELILKKHDHVFSGRPEHEAWVAGKKAMAFTPPGDYLRRVRQMCTQQLLGAAKIAEFEELRKTETLVSVRRLAAAAAAREVVDIDALLGELLENIMFTMVVGKGKEGENIMLDLKDVIEESVSLAGEFNLGDYIPILRSLDLQGIRRRFQVIKKKTDEMFDKIIDDHLNQTNSEKQNDILHTFLDLTNNQIDKYFSNFNKKNVKAITYEIFAGGIDTIKVVIIWALSLLIKNPRTLKTLQQEIDTLVGKQIKIKESDLAKLTYLDMVVKETLRLYPVGPLLVPHVAMDDVMIDGYSIPYKSRVIINAWAIGHDRKIWSENVEEFYPERFMNNENIDMNGSNFKLIPFGSGRRGCPGRILGLVNVKFILAQLVHCFDWEVSGGIDEMDMTEKFGLTIPRVTRLLVIPSLRLQIPDVE